MKNALRLLMVLTLLLCNSCDQSNSQLFDLILEIKSQNDQLLNEVKTLQLKSDLLISELRASAAKQEELLVKVTELQGQLSTILSQIDVLNQQLKTQDADVQLIKNQLAGLQTQYQGIFKQLEELQKLSQILAEIEKMKTQISQLDTRYTTILSGLAQNKQQLDALKTQITDVQTQIVSNLSKVNQLISQLGNQDVEILNIFNGINSLKVSLDSLKIQLNNLIKQLYPKIGDEYGGGLVFYIDETLIHGLIVSKVNLRDSSTEWGCYCQDIVNTKPQIGTGLNNTKEILKQCIASQNIPNWAAKITDQYFIDSFDDWYLPSKDELNLIYKNLHLKGFGNFSTSVAYWSSTQGSYGSCGIAGGAWTQRFSDGLQQSDYKAGYAGTGAIRAIRSF
jgi:uncharacterized coiled-coil DUF342 family protein